MSSPDIHSRIEALNLRVTHYIRIGSEWCPGDLIGKDGKALIIHRKADERYGFDGWEPWSARGPMASHGGRYDSLGSALAWLKWLEGQK